MKARISEAMVNKMLNGKEKQGVIENMLRTFSGYGIQIIKSDMVNKRFYISVPETSDSEYAGDALAKYVKDNLKNTKLASFKVMYVVRDEHWTKEKGVANYDSLKDSVSQFVSSKGLGSVL